MKRNLCGGLLSLFVLISYSSLNATERFVSLTGGHVPPFLDWATAATNIQEAIDVSLDGDLIWVTNGIYSTGGKVMAGDLTNRVALDKALTVQSVNGPYVTVIQGAYDPVATNGPGALRCAWLTNGAALKGFTLRGGATRNTGNNLTTCGGGVFATWTNGSVVNCQIVQNAASQNGGGAYRCVLIGSFLKANSALTGGGAYESILTNCTVTGNSGSLLGGGTRSSKHYNCIVYLNPLVQEMYVDGTFQYSCITPSQPGAGNISADPRLLADALHLGLDSPCRGAGGVTGLAELDMDGQPWADPPSMGCDEWRTEPAVGQLVPRVGPTGRLVFEAPVQGQPPISYWWFKDGALITQNDHFSGESTATLTLTGFHAEDAGAYHVVVSNEFGKVTSVASPLVIHCVDAAGSNPTPPFTNWTTAANIIQDAIDSADDGHVILVTNGVYASGGKVMSGDLTNRVALNKAILVQSVNGPRVTTIQGGGVTNGPNALRCAWVGAGARLSGFTLRGGATRTSGDTSGGAAWCVGTNSSYIANCLITGNMASVQGGGVYQGFVRNTAILTNSAIAGGGAYGSVLINCTLVGNNAAFGGGAAFGTVVNSIVYFNTNGDRTNNTTFVTPGYSCTIPFAGGTGNITADPQLVDGIYLSPSSPCRGSANPLFAVGTDLDGEAWLNLPSMGCDEFHADNIRGPLSVDLACAMSTVTEGHSVRFWGSVTGRASHVEWSFGDGSVLTNLAVTHSWATSGDYTLTFAAFNADHPQGVSTNVDIRVLPFAQPTLNCATLNGTNLALSFNGQPAVLYTLQQTDSLTPPVVWSTVSSNYGVGQPIEFMDSELTNAPNRFYRLQVD